MRRGSGIAGKRRQRWKVGIASIDYEEICHHADVDAVIICTPNFTHVPMTYAAAKAEKHVMCEKPLGLKAVEVRQMYENGVVHITAFTYRFAPSMRYMKKLLQDGSWGEPRQFRSRIEGEPATIFRYDLMW